MGVSLLEHKMPLCKFKALVKKNYPVFLSGFDSFYFGKFKLNPGILSI